MIQLSVGKDKEVADWVAKRVDAETFGDCVTYGFHKDGKIVGGVVFYDWRIEDMVFSVAFEDSGCITRRILRVLFDYPFNQVGCHRITAYTDVDNEVSNKQLKRLGFQKEGRYREISRERKDANIYGMLRRECIWLGEKNG